MEVNREGCKSCIPDLKIEEIRYAINSTKVLGNEVFKRQIEQQTAKKGDIYCSAEKFSEIRVIK